MESKVNYVAVGFFVILFSVVGMGMIVWIIGGSGTSRSYKKYVVCTNLNVNGLHTDSPVKYKGLTVGKVVGVRISKKNPDYLLIYALIRKDLRIDSHIVAQISSNGLTGISYIDLMDRNKSYACPKNLGLKYQCIPAVESSLKDIMNKLPRTVDKINAIVSKINSMLDNNTQNNFKKLMKNLANVSEKLNVSADKFNKFLDNANEFTSKAKDDAVVISKTVSHLDNLIKQLSSSLKKLDQTTLKESYDTIKEINSTTVELKQLIIEIRKNPALIIKGRKENVK
ncbi:MlaD family protein [Hippea alviniae]|uniref:MlaD family protein n=1 Tax=Hippea alviniae TaxID=1279027 RepID=UPI0003B4D567|nr:MlaD family protein [Hippea alviniae]